MTPTHTMFQSALIARIPLVLPVRRLASMVMRKHRSVLYASVTCVIVGQTVPYSVLPRDSATMIQHAYVNMDIKETSVNSMTVQVSYEIWDCPGYSFIL